MYSTPVKELRSGRSDEGEVYTMSYHYTCAHKMHIRYTKVIADAISIIHTRTRKDQWKVILQLHTSSNDSAC